MLTFQRDPSSVLDYRWNWAPWLAIGETISAAIVTVPAGLAKAQPETHDNTTVTVWLSGGTSGQAYLVTARITTSQGRTDERSIRLTTRER